MKGMATTHEKPSKEITAACLFLACKLTDIHIRISEFLNAFARKSLKNDKLRLSESELEKMRQKTVFYEEYVVVTLCFDFEFQDEFPYFMETSKILQGEIVFSESGDLLGLANPIMYIKSHNLLHRLHGLFTWIGTDHATFPQREFKTHKKSP
jgi:hypothetical protein